MAKKPPWKERCAYLSPLDVKCQTVTVRDSRFCPAHSQKLGERIDQESGSVTVTVELPAVGKSISDLDSADWEAIRLRLSRTAAEVTL
jgi:hypothetical protein